MELNDIVEKGPELTVQKTLRHAPFLLRRVLIYSSDPTLHGSVGLPGTSGSETLG